jgi:hypothetical protein
VSASADSRFPTDSVKAIHYTSYQIHQLRLKSALLGLDNHVLKVIIIAQPSSLLLESRKSIGSVFTICSGQ